MVSVLTVAGVVVAVFVGFNIGGSSTGVAFGPAVGSRLLRKATAAALFVGFGFLGAWTVGRNVIATMSSSIVPATQFTPAASVAVLFFTGASLLISNLYGVPASTSMTAVGAIVGLGLASNTLNQALMFTIVSAWIIAPLISLGIGIVVGRYIYPYLDRYVAFTKFDLHFIQLDRSGTIPRLYLNPNATRQDILGSLSVVVIACYMAFSAGASNAANAVAPLVGEGGSLAVNQGVLLAVVAFGLGSFTIARRTLETVGDDITELPILASLIVSIVGGTVITILSYFGIPASLAVSTTSTIIGLGWGRASRAATLVEFATPEREHPDLEVSTGALVTSRAEDMPASPTIGDIARHEEPAEKPEELPDVPDVGTEGPADLDQRSLFDSAAAKRIVTMWVLTPSLAVVASYPVFVFLL
ncbi:phosphate transporter [Haladaptatus paucihalophilus DX253]|uniref:Phosphate transporter n=1 Tax=Haladaptatus paucihalophilus DX253 TaxID=797209 RepID=E7QMN6_HALPU|nr:inorganic phosphate transporter [Haladaptatus paucihalophilus]EFW94220.1 phosphate transporter [Haladaptatus paucihalophilus DX253]SHL34100.1 inorganic phosphate transporter, PiT family [Haladaptatus paucihalophilus DX253]